MTAPLSIRRGDVFTARLSPVEGSERAGSRPAVVVSRNVLNERARVVIVVPLTTYRDRRLLPSQVLLRKGEAGLTNDSVALTEQVRAISKSRLGKRWGALESSSLSALERSLRIALDLP